MTELTMDRVDAHAAACSFLSRALLMRPDEALIASLREPGLLASWPHADAPGARKGLELLAAGLETPISALVIEWRDLFEGPDHVLACPYESVHLSAEHLVFEEQTLQVRRAYAAHGLQAPALNQEPDDHLGLELAFVAHLCLKLLDAAEATDVSATRGLSRELGEFVHGHVLVFAPTVAQLMLTHARSDFYRGLAMMLAGTCQVLATEFTAP